jgi:hypothetical protein
MRPSLSSIVATLGLLLMLAGGKARAEKTQPTLQSRTIATRAGRLYHAARMMAPTMAGILSGPFSKGKDELKPMGLRLMRKTLKAAWRANHAALMDASAVEAHPVEDRHDRTTQGGHLAKVGQTLELSQEGQTMLLQREDTRDTRRFGLYRAANSRARQVGVAEHTSTGKDRSARVSVGSTTRSEDRREGHTMGVVTNIRGSLIYDVNGGRATNLEHDHVKIQPYRGL